MEGPKMSASNQIRYTPEEYLKLERAAEFKNEYRDGQIYAMTGSGLPHNRIVGNFACELGNQLKDRPCELYLAQMRVFVKRTCSFLYPDAVVVCGQPRFLDNQFDSLINPNVIIEVLSPSTEAWDRGGKFEHYRRLESLSDYVLVSQNKILVEHFSRQGDQWLLTVWNRLDDSLHLASIACEVKLREIYEKVTLDAGEPAPGV
jgi:Uma2 family endonuclease